jgi:hypothetical protein
MWKIAYVWSSLYQEEDSEDAAGDRLNALVPQAL